MDENPPPERARPFRMRSGHVVGVARQAVTDDFGIDFRSARLGVLIFLEDHDARRPSSRSLALSYQQM